jgi:hypothetical protein
LKSPFPEPPVPPGPELPTLPDSLDATKPVELSEDGLVSKIGSSLKKLDSSDSSDSSEPAKLFSAEGGGPNPDSSLTLAEVSISGGINFFEQAVVINTQNPAVMIAFQLKLFIYKPHLKNIFRKIDQLNSKLKTKYQKLLGL